MESYIFQQKQPEVTNVVTKAEFKTFVFPELARMIEEGINTPYVSYGPYDN